MEVGLFAGQRLMKKNRAVKFFKCLSNVVQGLVFLPYIAAPREVLVGGCAGAEVGLFPGQTSMSRKRELRMC